MTEKTEAKPKAKELVDTKYGTIDAASVADKTGKDGKPYLEVKMTSLGGKETTLYARGKLIEAVKAKAAAGTPTFAVGELLAQGKGMSLSAVELKAYEATVVSVAETATNKRGEAYQAIKIQVAGKEKPWSVLLKGDDVGTAVVGEAFTTPIAWKAASDKEGNWNTSLRSASDLQRVPAPKQEEENAPGM